MRYENDSGFSEKYDVDVVYHGDSSGGLHDNCYGHWFKPIGYILATGSLAFALTFGADYAEAKPRFPVRKVGDSFQLVCRDGKARNLSKDIRNAGQPIKRAIVRAQQTNKRH